jgi:UPF0755 protein
VTDPGTPRRHGRHAPSSEGSGGVPPFYWVSTGRGSEPGRPAPRRAEERYGSSRYDAPAPPAARSWDDAPAYDAPAYGASAYDGSSYDAASYDARTDGYGSAAPSSWAGDPTTAGLRRVSGVLDRPADETGPIVEPEWWSHYPGDEIPAEHAPRHSSDHLRTTEVPLPPLPSGAWERLTPRFDADDEATRAQPLLYASARQPGAGEPGRPAPEQYGDHQYGDHQYGDHQYGDQQYGDHGYGDHGYGDHGYGDQQDGDHGYGDHGYDAHGYPEHPSEAHDPAHDAEPAEEHVEPAPAAWDQTGGLEVIGAHVEEAESRRRRRRRRPAGDDAHRSDGHAAEAHGPAEEDGAGSGRHADPRGAVHEADHGAGRHQPAPDDDDIPLKPYDPRAARARRRRRPLAVLMSLVVLAGLVFGIVVGGQALLRVIDPASRDFTGQGTGSIEIRVRDGDTLSDIARTLVDAGVIASIGPFVDAAELDPAAMSIQPGVYGLREQMSGQAALELLLDPSSRLLSRVTIPEGFTLQATLQRIADGTGTPIEELTAAAADPAALGAPAYTNGQLEGFLFPATYDFEPDMTAQQMLQQLVARFVEMAESLQLEQRAAALGLTPHDVVTVASMVESETLLDEERPDVAQVIYNRLARGMPLGIDATLAYGLGKNGNDLTVSDLQTDSPYNTRTRAGLPPTPISAPGEESLEAALSPTTGNLLYYVLESEDGAHFFTADPAEFEAARQRCADAGLGCGG